MKKLLFYVFICLGFTSFSQKLVATELLDDEKLLYVLSRMIPEKTMNVNLYNRGLFIGIYQISDSKHTPEKFSEGHDILDSYFISVQSDGDYFVGGKLYKIEAIVNPRIILLKETVYPNFSITFEHGEFNKREQDTIEFKGIEN